MKKVLFLFIVISVLIPLYPALTQNLNDYIKEVKGDTLVIKTYAEMGNQPDALYYTLLLDTTSVPAGRVYELQAGGWYPQSKNPTSSAKHLTVIVGSDPTRLVNNKNAASSPPLISGYTEIISNTGGINANGDLTIKNCSIIPGSQDGYEGWTFFSGNVDHIKLTLENCLLEQTRWVFLTTSKKGISWHIKDCYFVNMNDNYARRSGGVMDVFNLQDTLLVENSTHVMAAGYVYRLRNYPFERIIFNHNTFVNCANVVFQDYGFQSAMSVTNNIFINCGVKPYIGIGHTIDLGEEDFDHLPVGIVNVYPDTSIHVERRYFVDNNVVYWDPRFAGIVDTLNARKLNGSTNWVSQMIKMNQRTQDMFDDDANYPYLNEGNWYNELPNFTDAKNLLTSQVDIIKPYVITIMDTVGGGVIPDWRFASTDLLKYDWPIPVDLSYSNATLNTGATGGFPVGDLNWFPIQKAAWLAQRNTEYEGINNLLYTHIITGVNSQINLPVEFQLWQNHPNPFNPSTMISLTITKASYVTLKVYDMLGREVATLLDGFKNAQTYNIRFDGTGLASGIYFYRLTAPGFSQVKKMVLTK
jgi:hypothetical protein